MSNYATEAHTQNYINGAVVVVGPLSIVLNLGINNCIEHYSRQIAEYALI